MSTTSRITVEAVTFTVFAAFCLSAPRVWDLPYWTLPVFGVPLWFYLRWRLAGSWSCLWMFLCVAGLGVMLYVAQHSPAAGFGLLIVAMATVCWFFRNPNCTLQRLAGSIAEIRIRTLSRPTWEPVVPAALAGAAVLAWFAFGGEHWTRLCIQCGAIHERREWRVPLIHMIFVRNSSARETPVNIALMRAGLISVNHRHKWWFKQSGGPPPAVGSDGVAAIITASHRFGAFPLRDRMVEAVLDPKMANAVRALGLTVPADGFADAAEFRAWLARESENFEELIGSDAGAAASL